MERIIYRITMDTHKAGIQKVLQGFETGDTLSRRIMINLVAGGESYHIIPGDVTAVMYVTKPGASIPSINQCLIEGDAIIYDVLKEDISEAGIVIMQAKLIRLGEDGPTAVLKTPKIAVEVNENDVKDEEIVQTETFTALEEALAKATAYYSARLVSFSIDENYIFRAVYADGMEYISDGLSRAAKLAVESANKADAYQKFAENYYKLSQSYAVGETGERDGEDSDNAKFYCNESKSNAVTSERNAEITEACRDEIIKRAIYTTFSVDYKTGELMYESTNYSFKVDHTTGCLLWEVI